MTEKCININLKGRVQGVGFRYHTQNAASKYGIKGWVKNIPDGSVEIEAQAPEKNLELFVEACKKGPMLAKVKHTVINDLPLANYTNFEIK